MSVYRSDFEKLISNDILPNPLIIKLDVGVAGGVYSSTTLNIPANIFKTIKPISNSGATQIFYALDSNAETYISLNTECSVENAQNEFRIGVVRNTTSGHGTVEFELYH